MTSKNKYKKDKNLIFIGRKSVRITRIHINILGNFMSGFWEEMLLLIKKEIPIQQYDTWISKLEYSEENSKISIIARNRMTLDWVKSRFWTQIQNHAQTFNIKTIQLIQKPAIQKLEIPFSAEISITPNEKKSLPAIPATRQFLPNPKFNFGNFVQGKSNQLAHATALQVADQPGQQYSPLFIYGGVGLGKSHLCQAIGNQILENNNSTKISYIHAEKYTHDVVNAYKTGTFSEFKKNYQQLDLLIIDDIQFLGNKPRTQEEFFYAFNALIEAKKQVIITSDTVPQELKGMENRLISRFDSGLTVLIEPPELEMRVVILMNKANAIGMSIPEDVAFMVARQVNSNIRELEGTLNRIKAYSEFNKEPITTDSIKTALKDLFAHKLKKVTIPIIQSLVAEYYNIKVSDLCSKNRSQRIVRPRQMAMALAKELTNLSLPAIGLAFGHRDHTTVLHANQKIKALKTTDEAIQRDYLSLQMQLNK